MWGRLGVFQCSVPHHLEVLRCRQNWWGSNDFIYKGHPHRATVHHNLCSCTALQYRITEVWEHKRELVFRIELQRLVFWLIYWSKIIIRSHFKQKCQIFASCSFLNGICSFLSCMMVNTESLCCGLLDKKNITFHRTFEHFFFLHLMNFDKLINRESNLQNN